MLIYDIHMPTAEVERNMMHASLLKLTQLLVSLWFSVFNLLSAIMYILIIPLYGFAKYAGLVTGWWLCQDNESVHSEIIGL